MKKRNPQAAAAARLMQQLLAWRLWDDFKNHRHRKPWMWGQPILRGKPCKGPYRPKPIFRAAFLTRRENDGASLRLIGRPVSWSEKP